MLRRAKVTGTGFLLIAILGIILAMASGINGLKLFTIAPIGALDVTWKAEQAGGNELKPIRGRVFEFAPNCERMEVQMPILDSACAARVRDVQETVDITAESGCIVFPIKINGQTFNLKNQQPLGRQGYTVQADETSASFTVMRDSKTGESSSLFRGFSASYRITLDRDALAVTPINDPAIAFQKNLPTCVKAGAVIADSPRILGATVVDNKDGTFTGIGNVQQQILEFPSRESGRVNYVPSAHLGTHSIVVKPFVAISNNRLQMLPESRVVLFRESSTITRDPIINEIPPEPTFAERFSAFFVRLFERLRLR